MLMPREAPPPGMYPIPPPGYDPTLYDDVPFFNRRSNVLALTVSFMVRPPLKEILPTAFPATGILIILSIGF
jgi:hypothetical protein